MPSCAAYMQAAEKRNTLHLTFWLITTRSAGALPALLTSVTRDFSARVFCQTLYNKAECKHCRAQAADRSLSPDKCATQQRTRHSPNRAPFIHQFTNSNNDDQYNTTPSNTPSRASLSSGARSCKSGPAPARKQPRRPSLDWPARCPGRANGTAPRPTGATTYPLHGYASSRGAWSLWFAGLLLLELISRCTAPTTVRAAPTIARALAYHTRLQRPSTLLNAVASRRGTRCQKVRFGACLSFKGCLSSLLRARALKRELRLTLLRALTRLGNPAAN